MANHHTRQIPDPSEDQRQDLHRWLRRSKTSQALALRARIVLEAAEGRSDTEVAGRLGTTRATVGKWRRRFLRDGCEGLLDEPRPGAPRTIGDEEVERVVVKTLESLPRDATHWSTRSMAQACGLSAATVSRIWRAFALKPSLTSIVVFIGGHRKLRVSISNGNDTRRSWNSCDFLEEYRDLFVNSSTHCAIAR